MCYRLSEPHHEPLTRRAFLMSCGVAVGAVAAGLSATCAASAAEAGRKESKEGTTPRTFFAMPHSHIDVEWYWTFATTREWTADILNKAMALLRRDDLTVTEVCFAVGCSSLGTFSTRFTELVGMPPSAYREQTAAAATGSVGLPSCMEKNVTKPIRNREAPAVGLHLA